MKAIQNAFYSIITGFLLMWIGVAQAATISGTVSLPGTDTAPAGGIEIYLSFGSVSGGNTNLTIPQGQSSVSYSITTAEDDP
ncbi:MAG: hypothetical protein VSS75_005590, partial [Candidatus Parabeggiatoa sp.]|nr:hypothetical protein [Candidatus Parabeggiatoa sp.]